jgi:hypothetical protein
VAYQIRETKDVDTKVEAELVKAIKEFKAAFVTRQNIKLAAV